MCNLDSYKDSLTQIKSRQWCLIYTRVNNVGYGK